MRKVAFLVGNDTFPKDPSIPPLRFTQNDARELAAVLEDRETCGFETKLYLNRPSQEVLTDLDQISGELEQEDTLLFYYSGHGKLRGNELCLVSNETTTASLGATSIRTRLVLEYLQGSLARRRILILDCCHSGAIASIYKAVDSKSALDGLADSFGSYILTASTAIQLAEEREKDGHGVFTKALIDCLRNGGKEIITVNDWYEFAYKQLKALANQTPLKWGLEEQGPSFEIGNFRAKHERERERLEQERQMEQARLEWARQLEREQLISTARARLGAYVALGELTEMQAEEAIALLKRDEARLIPRERRYRDNLIRFSKREISFLELVEAGPFPRPEPFPKLPEPDVGPPITPVEAPAVDAPLTMFEPPAIDQPVTTPEPAVADEPVAPPEPMYVDQCIALPEPSDVEQPVALPGPKAPLRSTGIEDAGEGLIWLMAIIALAVTGFGFFYYVAWTDPSQLKPEYSQARSDSNYQALSDGHGDSGTSVTASPSLKDWGIEIRDGPYHDVVVTKVDPGTDVYKLGIRPGDVITYINTVPINTPADVTKILQVLKYAKEPFSVVVNGKGIKFKF